MLTTAVVLIAIAPLVIVFLTPLGRLRKATGSPAPESATWRPATAEVVSVLRASKRTFLLVRYQVGSRLIHNDVMYPLAGEPPAPGQRVPIRYDPTAPARMEFDLQRAVAPVAAAPVATR
jgi:Protein of unknown function (DUF3592)